MGEEDLTLELVSNFFEVCGVVYRFPKMFEINMVLQNRGVVTYV